MVKVGHTCISFYLSLHLYRHCIVWLLYVCLWSEAQQRKGPPQCHGSKKATQKGETHSKNCSSTSEYYICPHCDRLCGSRIGLYSHLKAHRIIFFNNRRTIIRDHRNNSPLPRLSNFPVPLSIPHPAHCALNRPSGNSKTNNIPVLCRPNKSVSEYLPDTPALLIQSQRYVTASNSRQNS